MGAPWTTALVWIDAHDVGTVIMNNATGSFALMRELLLIGLLFLSPLADARSIGIFNGAGICPGCAETVAALFVERGHRVIYLDQRSLSAASLGGLDVYVQPGGSDDIGETLDALTPRQIDALRRFVSRGGRYLGICAGAYLAARFTSIAEGRPAFGLVPIDEMPAEFESSAASLVAIRWGTQRRMVYNQSGPHMGIRTPGGMRALARYVATRHIAALAGRSGRGKVVLIGPHLEADESWYRDDGLTLRHGLNRDLFRAAMRWLD
jgi:glutamine amidotransferase-like uncharacterized protein